MNFEIGDLVNTPVGIGTVEGSVRLHGQINVMVSFLPSELMEADYQIHGLAQLNMFPVGNVKKVEEE